MIHDLFDDFDSFEQQFNAKFDAILIAQLELVMASERLKNECDELIQTLEDNCKHRLENSFNSEVTSQPFVYYAYDRESYEKLMFDD